SRERSAAPLATNPLRSGGVSRVSEGLEIRIRHQPKDRLEVRNAISHPDAARGSKAPPGLLGDRGTRTPASPHLPIHGRGSAPGSILDPIPIPTRTAPTGLR